MSGDRASPSQKTCFPSNFFVRQFGWPVWFASCNVGHFEQEETEKTEPEILSFLCFLLFNSFLLRPEASLCLCVSDYEP